MSVLLVIPARYASSRLPRKLLLADTGKPLICHSIDAAAAVRSAAPEIFSAIIVATDHPEISTVVNEYAMKNKIAAQAVLTAENHQSGTDRVAEAIQNTDAEIIINLQGDEPEINAAAVIALAKVMRKNKEIALATLGYPLVGAAVKNPNVVKIVCDAQGFALYFSRSVIPFDRDNIGEITHIAHCGIYAYRRAALLKMVSLPMSNLEKIERLEQLRALENGMKIYVHLLTETPCKGIDTPEDYREFVSRFAQNK